MQFWLCRQKLGCYDGQYYFTNFCPYRYCEYESLHSLMFWYPHWLGGKSFSVTPSQLDNNSHKGLEALGGEIPPGSCKNLVTGEIIMYDDLLPIDEYKKYNYYEWGID